MTEMGFAVVATMFALAVLVLLGAASRGGARRARRAQLSTAKEGEVIELHGVVRRSKAVLRAPVGGGACCAFTVEVRRQDDSGWIVVHARSQSETLLFQDTSGTATIDARAVSVDGVRRARFQIPSGDMPSDVAAFATSESLSIEPGMVVTQATVHDGDEVRVTGCACREPGAREGNYRVAAEGWVIREPASQPLSITVLRLPASEGV